MGVETARSFKYEEEFILNSRGLKLFTCRWVPVDQEPKALIFICHGYAMECSITMDDTGSRLARAGFAVYGIDYVGHGKSAGLDGYIPCFDDLVADCSDHFCKISDRRENRGKLRYLLGESMGGAVILLLHRKLPEFWDGAVLIAPMCKIADAVRPSPAVIKFLSSLSWFLPTWKLIPTKDIVDVAFRETKKREEVRANPYCYKGRPRLKTGYELFRVSTDIEQRLSEVTLPFLVLHGGEDKVTDLAVSEELYRQASSQDKTFKMYPGMWHSLSYGETPGNIDIVFRDVIRWLEERTTTTAAAAATDQRRSHCWLESQHKYRHDQPNIHQHIKSHAAAPTL